MDQHWTIDEFTIRNASSNHETDVRANPTRSGQADRQRGVHVRRSSTRMLVEELERFGVFSWRGLIRNVQTRNQGLETRIGSDGVVARVDFRRTYSPVSLVERPGEPFEAAVVVSQGEIDRGEA